MFKHFVHRTFRDIVRIETVEGKRLEEKESEIGAGSEESMTGVSQLFRRAVSAGELWAWDRVRPSSLDLTWRGRPSPLGSSGSDGVGKNINRPSSIGGGGGGSEARGSLPRSGFSRHCRTSFASFTIPSSFETSYRRGSDRLFQQPTS